MRLRLLAGALLAPALPVLLASPAQAVGNHICVSPVDAAWICDQTVTTVAQATQAASTDSQVSTIFIGQGDHEVPTTGIPFNGSASQAVQGSSEGQTVLTMPDTAGAQAYVNATNAVAISDLTIEMSGGANSFGDIGVVMSGGSSLNGVVVDGSLTENAQGVALSGSTITGSTITLPTTAGRAIYGQGGNTISGSTISGNTGFFTSSSGTENLSRLTVRAGYRAIEMDGGTINLDNTVVELTAPNASGVVALNDNVSAAVKTLNARHVTVVGGGANSRGVWARAKNNTVQQTAIVNLADSIIRTDGGIDLLAEASNTLAAGMTSTAAINVTYSDFHATSSSMGNNGAGGVVPGTGNLDVDPLFVDPASGNLRLSAESPVVDLGDPAGGGPSTDRDGDARVVDGDGDTTARRDMGAYELGDVVAPDTTIETGPAGPTSDSTPTFTFSSEPGATFECQVDDGGFGACSGPGDSHTAGALADGQHTFEVRASDLNGNTDGSAASRTFTVDTAAPETTFTAGPSGPVRDTTPTFRFSSEAGATFECRVDSGVFATCASPFTTGALSQGAHKLEVRAVDAASNKDPVPAVRSFVVDTVGPRTTLTKKPPKEASSATVKFKFTSDDAGATFQCKRDSKKWKTCTSPHRWKNLKPGKHTFRVRSVDAAGNVGKAVRYGFTREMTSGCTGQC